MKEDEKSYTMKNWVDKNKLVYKQDVKEDDLLDLIGKCICAKGTIPEANGVNRPYGFEGVIVGYSKEVVFDENDNPGYKYMFITDEGVGTAILSDMTWEVIG